MKIKKIQKGALTLIAFITFAASTLIYYTPAALAASVTTHIRIVGATRTIWYGDVTTDGCTVTDTDSVSHTYTQSVAVCAVDAASKTDGFSYVLKDFGGSLGLFMQKIAEDTGASDFSTYWSYDINGTAASQGISNQVVNNGDSLYFHFEDPNAEVNIRSINDGISYLRSQQQSTGQINGFTGVSGWSAMSFAAAGIDLATVKNGTTSLLDYLSANSPTQGASATDWEKGILAITAAGKDPYNFGGINYIQHLETYHNNEQIGATTLINDDVFGLLALISAGSGVPSQIKQDALTFILSHQNSDGGFSWSTTGISDVDDTASALQALVAAQKAGMTAGNLASAITNAKNFVLAAKNTDGGFASTKGDASNTSTTSWVVMALHALDISGTDITTADTYMRKNQEENGSFKWQPSSSGETFTTSYAVLALTGKYWPVKIFASSTPTQSSTPTSSPEPTPSTSHSTLTDEPSGSDSKSSGPTASLTLTVTPTITASVTMSPSPTLSPTVTPTSHPKDKEMRRREQQQRPVIEHIRMQLQKVFDTCMHFIRRGNPLWLPK
ncbi:MAG TPA: prenyltransferase/squalene oxidase repeat-containing protein [Candidatus Saccharimonadales bacterium]|nr:prenyltransferase/squalene oxidase repeat-containing protein [Candidatus Saccharimonadales bacterium]